VKGSYSVLLIGLALGVVLACAPSAAPTSPPTSPPTLAPTQPPTAAPATVQPTLVTAAPRPTVAPTVAPPRPTPTFPTPQPTSATSAEFDRLFIDMMVPHHEGALEMAAVAQGRAERPEIKAMAAAVLRTQAAEIEQMKAWRKAWFGSDMTPPMSEMPMVEGMQMRGGAHAGHDGTAGTMDMAADVEKLRMAREPFDIAFIDAMIPHHQDAVDASRAALQRGTRPEIKQLAGAIIDAQLREIGTMQQWRLTWAGNTGPAGGAGIGAGQPAAPDPPMKDEHAEAH
jgi:uncharacterized protein (DUF305 family)